MSHTLIAGATLGQKGFTTDDDLLGLEVTFADINYASTESIKPTLSQMDIRARLVRNDSGGTLAAGDCVRFDTGTTYGVGKAVDGQAAIGSDHLVAGFVDPYISSTVADDEFFWLIEEGPCKAKFTTGTTLTANDPIQPGASGRVTQVDVSTASAAQNQHLCGFVLEAVDTATASDTLFRVYARGQLRR